MRSTASSTRSGVAGASSRGQTVWPATLATASESACSTEMASISGGSPTAFDRWIVSGCASAHSAMATLKIGGTSEASGIL